jgi:D-aspartate ligase
VTLYTEHPVVLLGGGYNALSAARSLGRAGCAVHHGLDAGAGSFPKASRFVTSWMQPSSPAYAVADWMSWLGRSVPEGSVVIPCSDPALELLAHHRSDVIALGMLPAEADSQLVLSMLDKEVGYELARKAGLRVPRTEVVDDLEQGLAAAASFALPFAIKPRQSHRFLRMGDLSPKAVVVRRRVDLEPQLRRILDLQLPVLLTEVVPGPEHDYCSYYGYVDSTGRRLLHFTKRKLRQYPAGFGSGTYHVTAHCAEVLEIGRALFDAVNLLGLGNVEFKRDERDGGLTLIECNLRLTAATELLRRAGADVADLVYRRALGVDVDALVEYRAGLRQWLPVRDLLAVRQAPAEGVSRMGPWAADVAHRQSFPVLDSRDLGPSRVNAAEVSRRLVRAQAGRRRPVWDQRRLRASEDLLGAALRALPDGKLTRALMAEAGLLAGVGLFDYVRRWGASSPLVDSAAGRGDVYKAYWNQAAALVGADVEQLPFGLLRISLNGATTLVWDTTLSMCNPLVHRLAGDKPMTRALLMEAGLPVSEQVVCGPDDLAAARELLSRRGVVVVKPARSGGGGGVTCGVRRPADLVAAYAFALRSGNRVVVEALAAGDEYRLLVLDGEVVSTVLRRPPVVIGDGRSTVAGLVAQENARRRADPAHAGLYPITVDLDAVFTLHAAGLGLRTVPGLGTRVTVKTAVNENGPRDNDLVVPPHYLCEAAAQAAGALGAELAAVEIITPDATRPLGPAGGVVVEINTSPGLHYHYQVTNPANSDPVAARVLERLLGLERGRYGRLDARRDA